MGVVDTGVGDHVTSEYLEGMTVLWVALVKKVKLDAKANKEIFDIAFARARTQDDAVRQIVRYPWPQDYYIPGKSQTLVIKIEQFTEATSRCMVRPGIEQDGTKNGRRQRKKRGTSASGDAPNTTGSARSVTGQSDGQSNKRNRRRSTDASKDKSDKLPDWKKQLAGTQYRGEQSGKRIRARKNQSDTVGTDSGSKGRTRARRRDTSGPTSDGRRHRRSADAGRSKDTVSGDGKRRRKRRTSSSSDATVQSTDTGQGRKRVRSNGPKRTEQHKASGRSQPRPSILGDFVPSTIEDIKRYATAARTRKSTNTRKRKRAKT